MAEIVKSLKALADPTRLRLVALLQGEELSVHELQEITQLGQSRISTHLGLLEESGFLEFRREGKRTFYRLLSDADPNLVALARQAARELPEAGADQLNLRRILALRRDQARLYFNQVAGRFDRSYGPGRSWQAFAQMLLAMLPPRVIADLGSGEGLVSELLARRARQVIAVDNSEKMVRFGAEKAKANGLANLEFRLGDLEDPPIAPTSVDLVILSQALHHAEHPDRALRAAHGILVPGGQILILDLLRHGFAPARELYGDRWLGFSEAELHLWMEAAGFAEIEIGRVAREAKPPHFETILAVGSKAV
jgi:ArsR family transcriptional regulator